MHILTVQNPCRLSLLQEFLQFFLANEPYLSRSTCWTTTMRLWIHVRVYYAPLIHIQLHSYWLYWIDWSDFTIYTYFITQKWFNFQNFINILEIPIVFSLPPFWIAYHRLVPCCHSKSNIFSIEAIRLLN